MVYSNLYF